MRLVAAAAALAVAVVASVVVLLNQGWSSERRARELAGRVAAQASSRQLDNADFHFTAGVDAAAEFTALTEGMQTDPLVSLRDVVFGSDRVSGTAALHYEWPVLAGHPSWAYDVELPLSKVGEEWKASWSPTLVAPGLARDERLRGRRLLPARGEIVGAGGAKLASNQPATRVGIDKTLVDAVTAAASAKALAGVVGIDPERYATRVKKAGPRAYVEAAVLRDADPTQSAQAKRAVTIDGVRPIDTVRPLAINPSFARPLLGVVGEATPEAIERSRGAVRAGELTGLNGLQGLRDDVLRGRVGYEVQAVLRSDASVGRELYGIANQDGSTLTLSLNAKLQLEAERILAPVKPASAIVAIRPSNGRVLVAASGPGSNGYSTATLGQYAPGSTFKTVSGLGMLRAGVTASTPVACIPSILVDGMKFDNADGYPTSALGSVPFSTAFAHSCNAVFIANRNRVSQPALREAGDALGLNVDPDIVVPAVLGSVPADAAPVEHAAAMIGQGRVLASPLGMATVAASIAKGEAVRPVLVEGEQPDAVPVPARPLSAAEQAQLKKLMGEVVTKGSGRVLKGVPGGTVLAKTGTASYGPNPPRFHGWMIAIQGDLAVAVFVSDGGGGAKTAGPLLRDFLARAAAVA